MSTYVFLCLYVCVCESAWANICLWSDMFFSHWCDMTYLHDMTHSRSFAAALAIIIHLSQPSLSIFFEERNVEVWQEDGLIRSCLDYQQLEKNTQGRSTRNRGTQHLEHRTCLGFQTQVCSKPMIWRYDQIITFVPSSRENVKFMEELKKKI